jgi:tetratricopeptide (TPR) repeat protein
MSRPHSLPSAPHGPLARLLLGLLLPFLFALAVHGQSARWEPASGTLARDQTSQLALIFEDAEPRDQPSPPAVDGLTFGRPGRSEQTSLNLGFGNQAVRRRTITYTYPVRPTLRDGELRIPAFAVDTDAGRLTVPAAAFRLGAATVGESGVPLDQIADARFEPPATPVWAGQVLPLEFRLSVDRRYATNSILGGPLEWSPAPLIAEEWSKPAGSETVIDGQARLLVTMRTRAIAPASSDARFLSIPEATQLINLPTGSANPFSLFGQTVYEQKTLATGPARVAINPLPSPAPTDFIGAVGDFTLTSKVVPESATVGEPITWTLTLDGTGNWPAIDALRPRSLSRDFRVVSPRAQKNLRGDGLFDGSLTEDLVLIPQKPGPATLGPYTLAIFDPATGGYRTLRTEPVTIQINPAATPAPLPQIDPASPASPPESLSAPAPPPRVAPLPADPLGTGLGTAPVPLSPWPAALAWTALVLLAPAFAALWFAARHARLHDPLRARRAAHAELRHVLTRLEQSTASATPEALAPLLLAWQHAARVLLDLPGLTPSARDLPDPVWSALWLESERVLYRPSTTLAADWITQAWRAHARATPPPLARLAALRPIHLFGRASLGCFFAALLFAPPRVAAAESSPALAAYARGDFAAAEAALRPALAASPLDPALRHDLALALAQQGRWDEAAAHAHAALLQRPRHPALRRLLAATGPRASYQIPSIPAPARLLSVPAWQRLALAASLGLLGLVPLAYLASRHLPAPFARRTRLAGHCTLVLLAPALAAALLALRTHGPAAHPAAVLVWRDSTLRALPTELGDQQVTADLPAGTLARVDRSFLGWRHVVLSDGNGGWVRAEPLVGLWR